MARKRITFRRVAFHAALAQASAFALGRRALRGPRHPGWSLPFEVAISLMRTTLHRDHERAAAAVRRQVRGMPRDLQRHVNLRHERIAQVACDVHTPASHRSSDATLLYLHGGGYVTCSPASHRHLIARLAALTGARAVAPDYRLAPEHPFPAALDDTIAVYRALLDQGTDPARLFLAGDSAGGGLALAAMLRLRDEGAPLPCAAVLLSPWVDLSLGARDLEGQGGHDYLNAKMLIETAPKYAGDTPLTHPWVSPLFGDLRGLPPMLVQTGEWELFLRQNVRFVERARSAGVSIQHQIEPGMLHVFPAFADLLPQGRAALRAVGQFVRSFPLEGAR